MSLISTTLTMKLEVVSTLQLTKRAKKINKYIVRKEKNDRIYDFVYHVSIFIVRLYVGRSYVWFDSGGVFLRSKS
jgi:hypothetical protein